MELKKDCYFYYEDNDMGAKVPNCKKEIDYGSCPCSANCKHYITNKEVMELVNKKLSERNSK